jgi:hypothetical protein
MTGSPNPTEQSGLTADLEVLRNDEYKYKQWEYFSQHADDIKDRMWSTGTWLITLQTALLAYMVSQGFVVFDEPTLKIVKPFLTRYASIIGVLLSIYSIIVMSDYIKHIHDNWNRSHELLRKGPAGSPIWIPGITALLLITIAALFAYAVLIYYTFA